MQLYLNAEINVFSLFILVLIFLNTWNKMDKHLAEQRLFLTLILLNAMILISDTFTWILDGNTAPESRTILIISTVVYYLLHPIICLVWYLYVNFQINHDCSRLRKDIIYIIPPIIIYFALSIASVFKNFLFYYDRNNVYHRGRLFILVPLMTLLFILYTTVYIIVNRRKIHEKFFLSLIMFSIPLFIGAGLQYLFYGVSLSWTGMTISILIIFINIQNEQMNMDYLTGLFNRRQLDSYLKEIVQKDNLIIAGIMLDINSFKNINDSYGHHIGDEALKHASMLLKQTFDNRAFLSRYGGDEFVILLKVNSHADLDKAIIELKQNVIHFNELKKLSYEIDFSIGASLYPGKSSMNAQEFIHYIDALMYQDKQTLLQLVSNC